MKHEKKSNRPTTLITGAAGFIGQHLVQALLQQNKYQLHLAVRNKTSLFPLEKVRVFEQVISETTNWLPALEGCDVVIHLAGIAHVFNKTTQAMKARYRRVNVDSTYHLAKQAAAAGVKRFIFVSSIGVNGCETMPGKPFLDHDEPNPQNLYARSKLEAEQYLKLACQHTDMSFVIIRPPLTYGAGVMANFHRLIGAIQKGYLLPFQAIENKRSFVSVYTLVDLLICCMDHPLATNQTFLVSDGEDVSIRELLKRTASAMNTNVKLFAVPHPLLKAIGYLTGQSAVVQRLCGSLQVDITKTCQRLDWKPVMSMDQALRLTVKDLSNQREELGT